VGSFEECASSGCWPRYFIGSKEGTVYFVLLGLAFEAFTDVVHSGIKRQSCSTRDLESWVPNGTRKSISEIDFDKPIESWDQDAVGRQDFVKVVLGHVMANSEPAVGVTADFGEGKSSVLHLLHRSLEDGRKSIVVPFRTWFPGDGKNLLESLFDTATVEIRKKYFLPSWRSTLRRYGRGVLGAAPKSWEFLGEFPPSGSQSSEIDELAQLFSKLPLRVVFLLDEIDRMHSEEFAVLLKVLRGAPELVNVSYICAFNKEALARLVSLNDEQFGLRYIDKFFPVQLQLPRVDDDLRECLFSDRLITIHQEEEVLPEGNRRRRWDELRTELWYDALDKRLANFRMIGQYLRGFQGSLHVLKSEVNLYDLLVIESVRLLLPATYKFIYENGTLFHEPPKGIERWNRSHREIDEEARKRRTYAAYDAHFKELANVDGELARNLLARIFPSVKNYLRNASKGSLPLTLENEEDDRRISDANFFPRYFIYAVPASMFGEKEMEEFMASLGKAADEAAVKSTVDATWPAADRDDLRRIHFLRRLAARGREIPERQAPWLATEMARRTGGMLSELVVYQVIKGLVFSIAARFQGTKQMQEVLEQVVESAESDRFASDVVYSSVSERSLADEVTDWKSFDPEEMKKTFGKRMRLRHPRPVTGLLSSGIDPLSFSRWKAYVPEDAPYIGDFLRSAFDSNAENLGIFLLWLLPGNVGYQNGAINFIESFYPVAEVIQRLKSTESKGLKWSTEEAAAIKRFWGFHSSEGGGHLPPSDEDAS
jgi:hypothetical protein